MRKRDFLSGPAAQHDKAAGFLLQKGGFMRNKTHSCTEFMWNIKSNDKLTGKIDNKLYSHMVDVKRENRKFTWQVNGYITDDDTFMQKWYGGELTRGQYHLFTSKPGTGKSTLFLASDLPEDVCMVIAEPTKSICSQNSYKYQKDVCVIHSDSHGHVQRNIRKYVVTAELCSPVVQNIRQVFSDKHIWIVIDEAHELLFDNAAFRNGATTSILETVCNLRADDKAFFVTATPEALDNMQFDSRIMLYSGQPILSGTLNIMSTRITNGRITWTSAYAHEIGELVNTSGRPVLCFINNVSQMEKIASRLESNGYHTVRVDAGNRSVMDFVEKHGYLPACDNSGLMTKKIDVILTTSVILSGLNIHKNPQLGKTQYIPCFLSDKADYFNTSELKQFFTRTRYDVPCITLIKKECVNHNGYDVKATSVDKLESIIQDIIRPAVYGSVNGRGYMENESISGTESFLDEKDKLTDDLTFFDKQHNFLNGDSFAIHACAWNNYNSRLYVDSNRDALLQDLRNTLFITEVNYKVMEYNEQADRDTAEDIKFRRDMERKDRDKKIQACRDLLAMDNPVEKLYKCTNNPVVQNFRTVNRRRMHEIETINILEGNDAVIGYINELADGTSHTRQAYMHKVISESMSRTVTVNGFQTTLLFAAHNMNQESLSLQDREAVTLLKQTKEYKIACKNMSAGMTCVQAAEQSIKTDTLYEDRLNMRARAQTKAYFEGIDISAVSRFGSEIKAVFDRLVYKTGNMIHFVFGKQFTLDQEQLDGIATYMESAIKWKHKTAYSAKTVVKLLNSLFHVTKQDNGAVLVSMT